MRTEIRKLIDELQLTTLFVTHEQIEALTMSDVVAVMRDGNIVQSASPSDIYFNPAGPFIADFIGKTNLIEAKIIARQNGTDAQVETAIGPFTCRIPSDSGVGDTVFMVIRPEDIIIRQTHDGVSGNMLRGQVAITHFHGSLTDCVILVGAQSMRVHTRPQYAPTKGEMVDLYLPVEHCFAIRAA
jgi:ABC-type Fe3+/spermidine/putrescine transport system ATPase subunit